ncbi:MAG: methylenetetrahydrofolate reductase [Chloroflexi bacterium]|nr:methylenetetrahydrofolate reductase [Chloroflexota bacterium]
MGPDSRLAAALESKDFIVTAEYLPRTGTSGAAIEACASALRSPVTAVNVADNLYGVSMSSLAASVGLSRSGLEPIYQIVTRDRNRIAIQSDLLGAAFLGIKNVLCLSGYHQTLIGQPESANVFDIDSVQLIAMVKKMNEAGTLLNGKKIDGVFSMLIGAVANPYVKPIELNMVRLNKKLEAGARFIQTQAVFDVEGFRLWLDVARREGLTDRAAIMAGVMPLPSADEARRLADTYTDLSIPAWVIERLRLAGDQTAQKKEGVRICVEIVKTLKAIKALRGVHVLSGGNEDTVPEIVSAAG